MITIENGQFQDAGGNLITGTLTLVLSNDSQETVTDPNGQVASVPPINIAVTNGNAASTQIWGNIELNPTGTYYITTLVDSNGISVWKNYRLWVFTQATGSTVDLGTMTPSSEGTLSFSNPVLLTPSGTQTISTYSLDVPGGLYIDDVPVVIFDPTVHIITAYGAAGAARGQRQGATINATSKVLAILTADSNQFTAADIGKNIVIAGAGASGGDLYTTISSINSATSANLTAAASTSVSDALVIWWGTDQDGIDTAALNAAIAATTDTAGDVYIPAGFYLYNAPITMSSDLQKLWGDGELTTVWKASTASVTSFIPETDINIVNRSLIISDLSIYGAGYQAPVEITAWSYSGTTATFTAANSFTAGQEVWIQGFRGTTAYQFNHQQYTVLISGLTSSQFEVTTENFSAGSPPVTSGTETAMAFVDCEALSIGPGQWGLTLRNIFISGFAGAGLLCQTNILGSIDNITVTNCGWCPKFCVQPPSHVGGTASNYGRIYSNLNGGPGLDAYYLQSTTFSAYTAEQNALGGLDIDSCEGVTFNSPHIEFDDLDSAGNTSYPMSVIAMHSCHGVVVNGVFSIWDEGGETTATPFTFDHLGTNGQGICQGNQLNGGLFYYEGSTAPTYCVSLDSESNYNIVTTQFLGDGLTFAVSDSGVCNDLRYDGRQYGEGPFQINKAVGTSGNAGFESFIVDETNPRYAVLNNGFWSGLGTTNALDTSILRVGSGAAWTLPNSLPMLWGFSINGDNDARITLNVDSSGNPSLALGTGSAAADTWLTRNASGTVLVGETEGTSSGTLKAASITASTAITTPELSEAIATYNGSTTQLGGLIPIVESSLLQSQTADVTAQSLISASHLAANSMVRISIQIVLITPASTGSATSTLPTPEITFQERYSNTSQTITLEPLNNASATANVAGTTLSYGCNISIRNTSAVTYSTTGYASNTTAQMAYDIVVNAEYFGG